MTTTGEALRKLALRKSTRTPFSDTPVDDPRVEPDPDSEWPDEDEYNIPATDEVAATDKAPVPNVPTGAKPLAAPPVRQLGERRGESEDLTLESCPLALPPKLSWEPKTEERNASMPSETSANIETPQPAAASDTPESNADTIVQRPGDGLPTKRSNSSTSAFQPVIPLLDDEHLHDMTTLDLATPKVASSVIDTQPTTIQPTTIQPTTMLSPESPAAPDEADSTASEQPIAAPDTTEANEPTEPTGPTEPTESVRQSLSPEQAAGRHSITTLEREILDELTEQRVWQSYADIVRSAAARRPGIRLNVWAFVSLPSRTDASAIAARFACTLRESTERVCLIDANLADQTLTRQLGMIGQPGLSETLSGGVTTDAAMRPIAIERVQVVPTGDDKTGISRLPNGIDARRLAESLESWRGSGGMAVLDLGDCESAIMQHVHEFADVVVLILPSGRCSRGQISSAVECCRQFTGPFVSCVWTEMYEGTTDFLVAAKDVNPPIEKSD